MSTTHTERAPGVFTTLLPIMLVVLAVFIIIGLAMPTLPIHIHSGLGFGTFVVGLVTGSQFAAALISRVWAGHFADRRGAKQAVIVGLIGAAVSGLFYLLSLLFVSTPVLSVTILLVGRALLGGAESFIITGAFAWGLGLVDRSSSGKVIAWIGMAMYVAFAIGGPVGAVLYEFEGFAAVAAATTVIPLVMLCVVAGLGGVAARPSAPVSIAKVVRSVWVPGIGLAMSSFGFGAMTAFSALLFVERGWDSPWQPFSAFAVGLILARALLAHLPDKVGGARVALYFMVVEAVGLALMWIATLPVVAVLGAFIAGFGYSLVYPGLGVEAVHRVAAENRGLAMGTYTAFLDLTLGVASPVLGIIAGRSGLGSVFLVSAVVVVCASAIALRLMRDRQDAPSRS